MSRFLLPVLIVTLSLGLAAQPLSINSGNNQPNEPSLAVSRSNPAVIVAGANINSLYISYDTGKTWKEIRQVSRYGVWGDPVLYSNASGDFFHAHLARNANKTFPEYLDRMVVQRSTDNGITWSPGTGVGLNAGKVQDKEWLNGDENPGSPYFRNLYISWTEFDRYDSPDPEDRSRIRFSYSSDAGGSFSEPLTVSDTTGDCLDNDGTLEGATTAIGPEGQVYMTWAGHNRIWFDQSADGGRTFGRDKVIADQNCGWSLDIPNIYRSNGMPFIACDLSYGAGRGTLYVVYVDSSSGFIRSRLIYSRNNGETWSRPLTIGRDTSFGDCFFPNLSVNPLNGHLAIVYYNRAILEGNFFMMPEACIIKDISAFETHSEASYYQLEPFPCTSPGKVLFFGDYLDVDNLDSGFAAVWTSDVNDTLSIRFDRFPGKQEKEISYAFGYDNTARCFRLLGPSLKIKEVTLYRNASRVKAKIKTRRHSAELTELIIRAGSAEGNYELRFITPDGEERRMFVFVPGSFRIN